MWRISCWRRVVFTCIITRTARGNRFGTGISVLQMSGTRSMPSSRAASAGKVETRSGVVVKKIEAISSNVSTPFASSISRRSSRVASSTSSGSSRSTVVAPRIPRNQRSMRVNIADPRAAPSGPTLPPAT